jgi:UDP-glucose 4-epimerase
MTHFERAEISQRVLVTGGAGFIGSNLVDRLLALGHDVTAYDNLSTGQPGFLSSASQSPRFRLVEADLLDTDTLRSAMREQDFVFHLAANADVRLGTDYPARDLEQNTIATHNVLEAMRLTGVRQIAFSSTGSVYGEPGVFPTPEGCPFPVQTSLYGASKVAAEALISAYALGFDFKATIFRFVSILGERYSHGHVFDFLKKLATDPTRLEILGNGKQRKSYLYVQDCIDAMLVAVANAQNSVSIYNLGTNEYCTVNDSVGWICETLGVSPEREYTGGERGWIGDSPFIFLDCSRVRALGWEPKVSIREGILKTLRYLQGSGWLLEART